MEGNISKHLPCVGTNRLYKIHMRLYHKGATIQSSEGGGWSIFEINNFGRFYIKYTYINVIKFDILSAPQGNSVK